MKQIRAIDLFCGAGGSSWGAHTAGVKVIAGFDFWPVAKSVYRDNFPDAKFYCENIESLDPSYVKKELGDIDLILASPECTNHSVAKGNKPRCEKSRSTALQIIRFVKVFEPRWIIVENVVGMKSWARYNKFINDIEKLGYHTITQTLNSADFGVPQARRRLFIICDREKIPNPVSKPNRKRKTAKEIIDRNGKYRYSMLRTKKQSTLERAERAIAELGTEESFLLVYYGSDAAGGWQRLDLPLRTITTLDRFAFVKPTKKGYLMRMLQPTELKLAMGWPKKFKINYGTRRDKIKMIGNAVCPPVIKSIVRVLIQN